MSFPISTNGSLYFRIGMALFPIAVVVVIVLS